MRRRAVTNWRPQAPPISQSPGNHQSIIRQLSLGHRSSVSSRSLGRQPSLSHRSVIAQSSISHQSVSTQSSISHRSIIGRSSLSRSATAQSSASLSQSLSVSLGLSRRRGRLYKGHSSSRLSFQNVVLGRHGRLYSVPETCNAGASFDFQSDRCSDEIPSMLGMLVYGMGLSSSA